MIMSNIYKAFELYQALGNIKRKNDTVVGCKKLTSYKLTELQSKSVVELYSKYTKSVSKCFHEFYTEKTGNFYPEYIPDDLYYTKIDTFYNDWLAGSIMDNKCLYDILFPKAVIKQPETIIKRMNGIYYDAQMQPISVAEVNEILSKQDAVFCKEAEDSSGGDGVRYIDRTGGGVEDTFWNVVKKWKRDVIVQKPLSQCEELASLNGGSINTIRVLSLLSLNGSVKIYSYVLRMGIGGSKVDNACSGGINCGICEDGRLKGIAYNQKGDKFMIHPTSNVKFDEIQIPNFDKVIEKVKILHPFIPHFRLVSWDIAIDEMNEPVLIEANLRYGELDFHQLNNGPVFGKDTKKILDEVFGK